MLVGFKYINNTITIWPFGKAPLFRLSQTGQHKIADIPTSATLELGAGVYGLGLDNGSDVTLPKATRALGLIWNEQDSEDLYDNLAPALDILSNFPYAMQLNAGNNLRQLAKVIQRAVFQTRMQQIGLADVRIKFATPKFGYTNYALLEYLPDSIEYEEVEPGRSEAFSTRTAIQVTEDPTWPSHFRYLATIDEIFIPETWLANYKPAHITAGAGINQDIEVGFILNADATKIHMITLSPLHVLKTWSFSNEIRGFDIDDEYIYTLENTNGIITFNIYDWNQQLLKTYELGSLDLYGLAVMFNTLITYDATNQNFGIFEARYGYFKVDKNLKVYDAWTKASLYLSNRTMNLNMPLYTKRKWQPIDEYLWLNGYKRSDRETAALQYMTSYLYKKYKDQPRVFIEKLLQTSLQEINPLNSATLTLDSYATETIFENAKWGDYPLVQDGIPWIQPQADEGIDIHIPLQLISLAKNNSFYPVLFTGEGKQTLDEQPVDLTNVYSMPREYIYQRLDVPKADQIVVPIRYRDRYASASIGVIDLSIPAEAIIIQYEDGTSLTVLPNEFFKKDDGTIRITTIIDKYFESGKSQYAQIYQVQGDELIPIHAVPPDVWVLSATPTEYQTYDSVDVKQFELIEKEVPGPVKGNAKVIVDSSIKPNYLEATIEQPADDFVRITQLAYQLQSEEQPEKIIYTETSYKVTVIKQKAILQNDMITYQDDTTILETTNTTTGRSVFGFRIGENMDLSPSYTTIAIPNQQTTLSSEIPWEWIKLVRSLNGQQITYVGDTNEFVTASQQFVIDYLTAQLLATINVEFWVPDRFKIIVGDADGYVASKTFYLVILPEPPQITKITVATITVAGD